MFENQVTDGKFQFVPKDLYAEAEKYAKVIWSTICMINWISGLVTFADNEKTDISGGQPILSAGKRTGSNFDFLKISMNCFLINYYM